MAVDLASINNNKTKDIKAQKLFSTIIKLEINNNKKKSYFEGGNLNFTQNIHYFTQHNEKLVIFWKMEICVSIQCCVGPEKKEC